MSSGPLEEKSDRLDRWHGRWSENKLGWHQTDVHPCLTQYGSQAAASCAATSSSTDTTTAEPVRWLVTLCGKTVDMAYLSAQETTAHVVGVDGIRKALDEFAQEHADLKIQPDGSTSDGNFERLSGEKISLLVSSCTVLNRSCIIFIENVHMFLMKHRNLIRIPER